MHQTFLISNEKLCFAQKKKKCLKYEVMLEKSDNFGTTKKMKFLIINGATVLYHSKGQLNTTLTETAAEYLREKGHEVRISKCDSEYDPKTEGQNIIWADVLIWQFPAWWMSVPWTVKKYMDECLGQTKEVLYSGDGRSRSDSSKKYGTGGGQHGKRYMISVTWNAPLEAFTDENQFFDGKGVDNVFYSFHKAHQFCGFKQLQTFMCNDVTKNPTVPLYIEQYKKHLDSILSQL